MPQAGIDPLAQSHASYEASTLPQATTAGSHPMLKLTELLIGNLDYLQTDRQENLII